MPVSPCVPVPSVPQCPTFPFVSSCIQCPCSPPASCAARVPPPRPLHPHPSPTPPVSPCPAAPQSPCVPPHVPVPHARLSSAPPPPTRPPPAWAPHRPCQHPGLFWECGGSSRALGGARLGVTLGWHLSPPDSSQPCCPIRGRWGTPGCCPHPPLGAVPVAPCPLSAHARVQGGEVEAQTPAAAYWLRPLMSLPREPKGHFVFDCK